MIETGRNITERQADAQLLIEDFISFRDIEQYSDPEKRLRFLKSISPEAFLDLARHVNARMRHMDPSLQPNAHEGGATLPLLGTPPPSEKKESFLTGAQTIRNYLSTSQDTTEEKLRGAGMAAEALIIWVHPFDDGNGRASRFIGKFIEDGTENVDELATETVDGGYRQRVYSGSIRIDEWNTVSHLIESDDLVLDEDEIEELKKTAMPFSEGIAKSLQRLLEDKALQERILNGARQRVSKMLAYIASKGAA